MSFEAIQDIVKFISNFAEEQAILLPGRIPGYKRDDMKLLPSSTTKKVIQRIIIIHLSIEACVVCNCWNVCLVQLTCNKLACYK